MDIREAYRTIQKTGEKGAGAAKNLLLPLLKRGSRGFRYPSQSSARAHMDVRILLDLGYALWQPNVVFAGIQIGGKIVINPQLPKALGFKESGKPQPKKFPNGRRNFDRKR